MLQREAAFQPPIISREPREAMPAPVSAHRAPRPLRPALPPIHPPCAPQDAPNPPPVPLCSLACCYTRRKGPAEPRTA